MARSREGVTRVIGVDPGPRPGVCALDLGPGEIRLPAMVFETEPTSLLPLLRCLIGPESDERVILAVEQWAIGPISRAARSAGVTTRTMIGEVATLADSYDGVTAVLRRAADVMPWATDKRLDAAGLLAKCVGLKDARAAARHALFSAVRDGGAPDPLIRR